MRTTIKPKAISLILTLLSTGVYASSYEVKDENVTFKATCPTSGDIEISLEDVANPRHLMITNLDYLPMVSISNIRKDTHRKGYTPYEELILLDTLEYKDIYGQNGGSIDISKLKSFISNCKAEQNQSRQQKELRLAKIQKAKQEKLDKELAAKQEKELQIAKEKQLAKVNARKLRKEQLEAKEAKLLTINSKWKYQGVAPVNSLNQSQGTFVTIDLAPYKLVRQLDSNTYLFMHISDLPEFAPIVLTSESFYREGFSGPRSLDVLHFGVSLTENGQVIKATEVK